MSEPGMEPNPQQRTGAVGLGGGQTGTWPYPPRVSLAIGAPANKRLAPGTRFPHRAGRCRPGRTPGMRPNPPRVRRDWGRVKRGRGPAPPPPRPPSLVAAISASSAVRRCQLFLSISSPCHIVIMKRSAPSTIPRCQFPLFLAALGHSTTVSTPNTVKGSYPWTPR